MQRQDKDTCVVNGDNKKITVYDVGGAVQDYKHNAGFFRGFGWQSDMSKLYYLYHSFLKADNDVTRALDALEAFKVISILVTSQIRQESASCHAITQLEGCCGDELMRLCRLLCMHNALTERNFKSIYDHFDKISQIKTNVSYLIDANVAKPNYIDVICKCAPESDINIPFIIKQYEGFGYSEAEVTGELQTYLSQQSNLSLSPTGVQSTTSVHKLRGLLGVPDNDIDVVRVSINVSH